MSFVKANLIPLAVGVAVGYLLLPRAISMIKAR